VQGLQAACVMVAYVAAVCAMAVCLLAGAALPVADVVVPAQQAAYAPAVCQ